MIYRKLHINGKVWGWKYIKSKVLILTPENKKIVVSDTEITGWSNDTIERAKWKKYFRILPSEVSQYITDKIPALMV